MPSTARHYSWNSSAIPDREAIVTRYVLERHLETRPDATFIVFEDGSAWSYAQTIAQIRSYATALAGLGVRQGDRVLVWLPNCPECVLAWLAINWLGATYVPVNTAYKGGLLEHVVNNAGATVLMTCADLAPRLRDITAPALETPIFNTIVLCDTDDVPAPDNTALTITGKSTLACPPDDSLLKLPRPIEPWDEQYIIYTSGTTGPSKGVLCSYCHAATMALVAFEHRDAENFRYMLTLPLFHTGGTVGVLGPLLLGRSFALVERFDTKAFWTLLERTGSNSCTLLGAMATFLNKQEDGDASRNNPLEWAYIIPYTEDGMAFAKRFGVDVYTMFNMTETSVPIISGCNPASPGICGTLRPGIEARLVDEHDREVADGDSGELMLRADRPWSMNHGYNGNPQATAAAWRNGWFHTGDMFRKTPAGEYLFVDRRKDAIRRRGENISSFEVERECLSHPDVQEAAAIAVSSEFSEDDVMVVIALVEGRALDCRRYFDYLRERMAYFMLPRYIRIVDELPKTPTQKVMKEVLRREGVTTDTWDREAHGIVVKADRAGQRR